MPNRALRVLDGDSAQNEGLAGPFRGQWFQAVQVISMTDSGVLIWHEDNCTRRDRAFANGTGPSVPIEELWSLLCKIHPVI